MKDRNVVLKPAVRRYSIQNTIVGKNIYDSETLNRVLRDFKSLRN
jgi:hypothetical protein